MGRSEAILLAPEDVERGGPWGVIVVAAGPVISAAITRTAHIPAFRCLPSTPK